ncbi:MAG: hypothetical protein HN802_03120 [Candidatus Jacksonbacteria bacterium]|jgi:hypothetical protein|nr:hypothetical protein [Candidatus Jacksonbacteria bacterium]MBT6757393.1 hypothetical protein [Candidatus Jacksonbacteria bacterium]MBT7008586.1 hypothetical protein [Candidatus Jacksonbacteria bacterium]MBT7338665.1 hypothetical protein [Candidatus Jacksonbacteria bacterium]
MAKEPVMAKTEPMASEDASQMLREAPYLGKVAFSGNWFFLGVLSIAAPILVLLIMAQDFSLVFDRPEATAVTLVFCVLMIIAAGIFWRYPTTGFTTGVGVASVMTMVILLATGAATLSSMALFLIVALSGSTIAGIGTYHLRHLRAYQIYRENGGTDDCITYRHTRAKVVRNIRALKPRIIRRPSVKD